MSINPSKVIADSPLSCEGENGSVFLDQTKNRTMKREVEKYGTAPIFSRKGEKIGSRGVTTKGWTG